jgi:hypothetical protein
MDAPPCYRAYYYGCVRQSVAGSDDLILLLPVCRTIACHSAVWQTVDDVGRGGSLSIGWHGREC